MVKLVETPFLFQILVEIIRLFQLNPVPKFMLVVAEERKEIKVGMEMVEDVDRQLVCSRVVSKAIVLIVLVVGINTILEIGAVNGEEDVMLVSGGENVKDTTTLLVEEVERAETGD